MLRALRLIALVLPLLASFARDRRRWLVCLVRFPTAEGVAAIHGEPRQHRYITI